MTIVVSVALFFLLIIEIVLIVITIVVVHVLHVVFEGVLVVETVRAGTAVREQVVRIVVKVMGVSVIQRSSGVVEVVSNVAITEFTVVEAMMTAPDGRGMESVVSMIEAMGMAMVATEVTFGTVAVETVGDLVAVISMSKAPRVMLNTMTIEAVGGLIMMVGHAEVAMTMTVVTEEVLPERSLDDDVLLNSLVSSAMVLLVLSMLLGVLILLLLVQLLDLFDLLLERGEVNAVGVDDVLVQFPQWHLLFSRDVGGGCQGLSGSEHFVNINL